MTSFAEITGVLDRAQNPDALLTDGSRSLNGNLAVAAGITVDGVDISVFQSTYQAHLANPTAHGYVRNILDDASAAVDRNPLTNEVRIYGADGITVTKTASGLRIAGSGGSGGGGACIVGIKDPSGAAAVPDALSYISFAASNVFAITAATNSLAFALVPGNINHQTLGGRGPDDHHSAFIGLKVGATTVNPDASDVITIAAGTNVIVTPSGSTITVGISATPTLTGLTVNGNILVSGTVDGVDVSAHKSRHESGGADAINHNALSGYVANEHIDHSGVSVIAGNGLTGGGTIAANRTLSVNQDYDFDWTGLHTFNEHTEMESVNVNGALSVFDDLTVFYGGYYPLFVNVDTVNPNNSNVGIMTNSPDPQFALDVAGPIRGQYLVGPHAIQLSDAAMICHFDGPTPYTTNFDGFAAGHLGQVATVTGGVIYRSARFEKGVQVAEATTNLIANPSFETNTTGWIGYQTGSATGTRTRTAAQSLYGDYSYEIIKTGGAATADRIGGYHTFSAVSGTTYTISAWIKVTAITGGISTVLFYVEGTPFTTPQQVGVVGVTDWQRVSVTMTASSTGTGRVYIWVHSATTATVYVDAVQVEAKAYATPYCDGSLGNSHEWTGTAHASTSTRSNAVLSYALNLSGEVTAMMWFRVNAFRTDRVVRLLASGADDNSFALRLNFSAVELWFDSVVRRSATVTAGVWHHVAATWSPATGIARLYLNGVQVGADVTGYTDRDLSTWGIGNSIFDTNRACNGLIDDLVILSRAAPADEIRAIYESNAPVFAESSITAWRTPTQVPIWVDSEGMWMRAVGGGETLGAYGGDATKSWGGKTLYQSDFLLGNATDGYVHWHAFQDEDDPWGAAGMDVKGQIDITGSSSISGSLSAAGGDVLLDNTGIHLKGDATGAVIDFRVGSTVVARIKGVTEFSTQRNLYIDLLPTHNDTGAILYIRGHNAAGTHIAQVAITEQGVILPSGGMATSAQVSTGNLIVNGYLRMTGTGSGNYFTLNRLTTTQRDALSGQQSGTVIYNVTTNKAQVWTGSAWVDLH